MKSNPSFHIDFKEIVDYAQAQALASKLHPTDDSVWRQYCREYSKLFYTPLHQVMDMDPFEVISQVYEEQLDGVDIDEKLEVILDMIYSLDDPEYAKQKRDELKSFIKQAEEEEELRQEEGRPIHRLLASEDEVSLKNTSKTPPTPTKTLPQGGGVNMSWLEREDQGDGEF